METRALPAPWRTGEHNKLFSLVRSGVLCDPGCAMFSADLCVETMHKVSAETQEGSGAEHDNRPHFASVLDCA